MFTLEQLTMITSLTDRTLRNYIRDGYHQGEKTSGKWLFTAEQVESFMKHPMIVPALKSKKMSIITDFLGSEPDSIDRACVILDVCDQKHDYTKAFLQAIPDIINPEMRFDFASDVIREGVIRVIISGAEKDVFRLIDLYREKKAEN